MKTTVAGVNIQRVALISAQSAQEGKKTAIEERERAHEERIGRKRASLEESYRAALEQARAGKKGAWAGIGIAIGGLVGSLTLGGAGILATLGSVVQCGAGIAQGWVGLKTTAASTGAARLGREAGIDDLGAEHASKKAEDANSEAATERDRVRQRFEMALKIQDQEYAVFDRANR